MSSQLDRSRSPKGYTLIIPLAGIDGQASGLEIGKYQDLRTQYEIASLESDSISSSSKALA